VCGSWRLVATEYGHRVKPDTGRVVIVGECRHCERIRKHRDYLNRKPVQAARHRERMATEPEYRRREEERVKKWKAEHPDRVLEHTRRRNAKPEQKRAQKLYRRRVRKRFLQEARAGIPTCIVQPYLAAMVNRASGGVVEVATRTGIPERTLQQVLKLRTKSVHYVLVDLLAQHEDFSLQELMQRAREWALLTGDDWPKGYTSRGDPLKR